jgi:hypothetical protein
MTKLYILGIHIAPPSPWANETGFSNRYVRACETPEETGEVVLSPNHTHSISSSTVGTSGYWDYGTVDFGGSPYREGIEHDNHALSASFDSVTHTPPYYGLALWSIDLGIWETAVRKFPTGAVLLSSSQISDEELTRFSDGDGRLIRIGTPGTMEGSATHSHTVAGSLSDIDASFGIPDVWGFWYIRLALHSHTFSGSTGASELSPTRIQTRLYKAISTTTRAAAGVVCFVDGTPSSNWEAVSWGQRCIESSDCNATPTGSDSHNHSYSGYSSTISAGLLTSVEPQNIYEVPKQVATPHGHSVSLVTSIESHVPSHVKLYPVRLKFTLRPVGKASNLCGC